MEVNREWWDGEARELYVDGTIGATPVITTCPKLENSIRANFDKYSGVEWDKSICPWKINYKSDFFGGFQWALPYYQTGVEGTTMVQSPLFKERKKGYTFYLSAAGGSTSSLPHEIVNSNACTKPLWKTCLSTGETDLTNTDIDYWFNLKYRHIYPVINFDYSKIFVAPMIHTESSSGWVFYDNERIRANWDPTGVYGISLMFYAKNKYNTSVPICAGLFSLNNKFAQPEWDTTNCWKEDTMFDNALAVAWCNAWNGYDGYTVGGIQTLGSNTLWGTDPNNPGFADQTFAGPDAAGSVMYFPMKNIMIQSPSDEEDTIWSTDWDHFYMGGGYSQGCKRHLKSTVTYDQFADYLKQQLAYLGFRFCIDGNHLNDAIDSQYFFIPEIDEKGVTTGTYYQANSTEAQSLPNNTWTNDVYTETPYDGTDDEEDDDPTDWDVDLVTTLHTMNLDQNVGCKDYLMTGHALGELIRVLSWYKAEEEKGDVPEGTCVSHFGTTDPLECIQTVICYPYDLTTNWAGGEGETNVSGTYMSATQGVYCGLTELVVNPGAISSDTWNHLHTPYDSILDINWIESSPVYASRSIPYFDRYKSFLSYEPYCDAELYIPFCGTVKIDPQLFIGHRIGVLYSVSVSEGACRADIYRDGLMVDSITGNMGAQIGLSSADIISKVNAVQQANATISSQKTTLVKSVAGFGIAAAATVATGGTGAPLAASLGASALGATASAVSARQSIETAEYQIKQAEVPFHKLTTGHGFLVLNSEDGVRLNVYRPETLPGYSFSNWGSYGHTTGFACLENQALNNFHGLTVCSSVDLTGTTCTAKEAEMIKSALKSGVYLP